MKTNLNELISAMSEQLSRSDIVAAEQLAKVSATITKRRLEMKMNQKDFAKFLGVSQSLVSKWESEDYNFTIETLAKICDRLDLNLDVSIKDQKKEAENKLRKIDCGWIRSDRQRKANCIVGVA